MMNVLYIPQCIYFYEMRFDDETNCEKLYIPQCIYFYPICRSRTKPRKCFTFHNVSISTKNRSRKTLINHCLYIPQCIYFYASATFLSFAASIALHSTMYLFLLHGQGGGSSRGSYFTFHNVSISTPSNLLTLKYSDYIPCFVDFLPYINSITNLYL